MAEDGAGGRLLVRGLVAAGLALAMLVLGVRTMVGRMSERSRQASASATSSPEAESTGREGTGRESTGRESRATTPRPASTTVTPGAVSPTTTPGAGPSAPGTATTTATASSAPPAHRGTMDAMAVRAVVRDALPEIRFCFEWQLDAHPDLAGRVTMQFTIQQDGSVANASVLEDALHDDTVTTCFTHVMSHLHFPPPEGGSVDVNYPFSLSGAPEAQRPEGI